MRLFQAFILRNEIIDSIYSVLVDWKQEIFRMMVIRFGWMVWAGFEFKTQFNVEKHLLNRFEAKKRGRENARRLCLLNEITHIHMRVHLWKTFLNIFFRQYPFWRSMLCKWKPAFDQQFLFGNLIVSRLFCTAEFISDDIKRMNGCMNSTFFGRNILGKTRQWTYGFQC